MRLLSGVYIQIFTDALHASVCARARVCERALDCTVVMVHAQQRPPVKSLHAATEMFRSHSLRRGRLL